MKLVHVSHLLLQLMIEQQLDFLLMEIAGEGEDSFRFLPVL